MELLRTPAIELQESDVLEEFIHEVHPFIAGRQRISGQLKEVKHS